MTLDLTDEESAALLRELDDIIDNDRYPFSPRIRNAENSNLTQNGSFAELRKNAVSSDAGHLGPHRAAAGARADAAATALRAAARGSPKSVVKS